MKVIDAHTGFEDLKPGDKVPLPGSGLPGSGPSYRITNSGHRVSEPSTGAYYRIISIHPGIFHAFMIADFFDGKSTRRERVPLKVRWTHPGFPLQHVAFVPS